MKKMKQTDKSATKQKQAPIVGTKATLLREYVESLDSVVIPLESDHDIPARVSGFIFGELVAMGRHWVADPSLPRYIGRGEPIDPSNPSHLFEAGALWLLAQCWRDAKRAKPKRAKR